ncbi:MAG: hypothetical protein K2O67_00030, partial [Clostridia bacterium]|nr:hypothetical protein [Clostridia bacterium]
ELYKRQFLNTAIANIDHMSFGQSVSAANKDLFKMLFTKGYLSDANPDERLLKEALPEEISLVLPYLNISEFVTKRDVQIIFNVAMDVLSGNMSTVDNTVALIGKILPQIKNLSVLSEDRAEELNPVMGRLYCYAANTYLTETGSKGVTYASVYKEKIDWVGEMRSLIEVSDATLSLYKYAYTEGATPAHVLDNIFDESGEHYEEICEYYDAVCDNIVRSRILGQVMSTSKMYNTINAALSGVFNNIYIPENVRYDSKFDSDGNLVSAGEMYNLLNGVRLLGRNTEVFDLLHNYDAENDKGKLLDTLSAAISVKDDYGNTLCDYIV